MPKLERVGKKMKAANGFKDLAVSNLSLKWFFIAYTNDDCKQIWEDIAWKMEGRIQKGQNLIIPWMSICISASV